MAKAKTKTQWKNRIVDSGVEPAANFLANPENWRIHPKGQQEALSGALNELGWIQEVIVNRTTGNMIDGHLRVTLALRQGDDTPVPVKYVELTPDEERLALLTLDPIAAMAAADKAKLDTLMQDINTGEAGLQAMLAELAADNGLYKDDKAGADTEPQVDKAEELRQKWGVESGQMWQLGEHRLICGDCTDPAVVARVMGGEKAEYGIQDPPYGISVVGGSKPFGSVGGSKPFGSVVGSNIVRANNYHPIVDDDKPYDPSYILSICHNQILWGANYYADKLPPRKGWIVWDKKGKDWDDNFSDCELAWSPFDTVTKIYRHLWMGIVQEGKREQRQHPTQKPSALYEKLISDYFTGNGIIIDFYLGSGTTIIACENLNRRCRAIEIDAGYVAVALERWAVHTGKTPVLISGDK